MFLHADSEDSDQTGRMPRLIRVFAWRKCHFVGFVMRRLIFVGLYVFIKWSCILVRVFSPAPSLGKRDRVYMLLVHLFVV